MRADMKHRICLFIVAAVMVLNAVHSPAQAHDSGTLVATVTDPSGAVQPNAHVWIRWNDLLGC